MLGDVLRGDHKELWFRREEAIDRTLIFSSMYILSRVFKDFFMISRSEPIINTMQTRFS